MAEQDFNYQADLAIDKNHLDVELISQAQKMMRYSAEHAQAQYDRDHTKRNLDVVRANEDARIRTELIAAEIKFTEAVVDGRVKTSPNYQEAQDFYIKAEYKVNLLLGVVMAMNARRTMLESLVRMIMSDWWAEPRIKGIGEMKAEAAIKFTEEAIIRNHEFNLNIQAAAADQEVKKEEASISMRPTPRAPVPPPKKG